MFSLLVICYLFLGGCGAGTLLMASLLQSSDPGRSGPRAKAAAVSATLVRLRVFVAGVAILALAALFLLVDLGRPDRVLNLLTMPQPTWITFGTWALIVALAAGMGAVFALTRAVRGRPHRQPVLALRVLCGCAALALMFYTGMFLAQIRAVAFWNSWALVALFVLSALSCGMSVTVIACELSPATPQLRQRVDILARAHAWVIAVEGAALAFFLVRMAASPSTARSVEALLAGDLSPWFLAGVVGLGLAVPLGSAIWRRAAHASDPALFAEVAVLVGAFLLRYCLVMAGAH